MSGLLSLIILAVFLASPLRPGPVYAGEPVLSAGGASPADGKALLDKYQRIEEKLAKNQFGIPLYLESEETGSTLRVDVYGILDYHLTGVRDALRIPGNWCDIVSLHINIKACTCKKLDNAWLLTVYSGRKFYQHPDDAYQLKYNYRIPVQDPEYIRIALDAGDGPLNTKDHRLELEVAPLHGDRTFIHLSYAYAYGALGRFAMKGYFATLGRGKIGFSITSTDEHGNPVYADGVKGAVERNAVRYYFAVQAYLDTLKFPDEQRFEKRIGRWYDLTGKYPKQLFEMDRETYLGFKRREHRNRLMLQEP